MPFVFLNLDSSGNSWALSPDPDFLISSENPLTRVWSWSLGFGVGFVKIECGVWPDCFFTWCELRRDADWNWRHNFFGFLSSASSFVVRILQDFLNWVFVAVDRLEFIATWLQDELPFFKVKFRCFWLLIDRVVICEMRWFFYIQRSGAPWRKKFRRHVLRVWVARLSE